MAARLARRRALVAGEHFFFPELDDEPESESTTLTCASCVYWDLDDDEVLEGEEDVLVLEMPPLDDEDEELPCSSSLSFEEDEVVVSESDVDDEEEEPPFLFCLSIQFIRVVSKGMIDIPE